MDLPFRSSGPVDEPAGADGAAPGNRRPVLLGLLGAVVLAAGGFLLLSGGSPPTDVAPATLPTAPAATADPPTPAASASPVAGAAVADLRTGRDPFQPLGRPGVAAADPAPVAVPPPGTSPPTAPAAPARALRTLSLLAVEGQAARRTAVFTLDGTRVRAGVGHTFGPAGDLLLLSLRQEPGGVGWTAVVQATGGEPFDVATGRPASLP